MTQPMSAQRLAKEFDFPPQAVVMHIEGNNPDAFKYKFSRELLSGIKKAPGATVDAKSVAGWKYHIRRDFGPTGMQ